MLDEDEALANNNNPMCSICGGDNGAAFIFYLLDCWDRWQDRNVARKKASVWIDTSTDREQSKKLRTHESGMSPWVMSQGRVILLQWGSQFYRKARKTCQTQIYMSIVRAHKKYRCQTKVAPSLIPYA